MCLLKVLVDQSSLSNVIKFLDMLNYQIHIISIQQQNILSMKKKFEVMRRRSLYHYLIRLLVMLFYLCVLCYVVILFIRFMHVDENLNERTNVSETKNIHLDGVLK